MIFKEPSPDHGWPGAETGVVWTIFAINVLTIAVAFKKRMILHAVLAASFLYLVTGQAVQIRSDLERSHTVVYLLNFISDVGFNMALWYVLGVSCVSLGLVLLSKGYRRDSQSNPMYVFAPSRGFYLFLFLFLCFLASVLIFAVVGLETFLHSSRPGFETGSTIFLVLLFLGVMPLLLKILLRGQIEKGDIACCLVSFVVSGAFSRTDLIMYLLAILLALYYARGWANADLTLRRLVIVCGFGVAVAVIIVGIGALHDAQNLIQGSVGDLLSFILSNPEKSVLSLEYNYRVGIEGMSGIAGSFTQYLSNPNSVHHDFGISWLLKGVLLSLPGFLKTYADGLAALVNEWNWYPFSIIPTGAESFFTSFGWAGVLLYPIAVYVLTWSLPLHLQRSRLSPLGGLISYALMTCTLYLVHGPLATWIAFSFAYSVVILVFWPLFRPHIKAVTA